MLQTIFTEQFVVYTSEISQILFILLSMKVTGKIESEEVSVSLATTKIANLLISTSLTSKKRKKTMLVLSSQ